MNTLEIAMLLGVAHELVRDAAGSLCQRCGKKDQFSFSEAYRIRVKLIQWGKLSA